MSTLSIHHDYQLRPLQQSDLETVLHWRNSDRIRTNMYTDHLISWEEHCAWFEKNRQDETVVFKIFEFQKCPVGVAQVTQIDKRNNKCHWGLYLGEPKIPRGSGTIMGFLVLENIFESLQIRKLCCEVFQFNQAAINLYKRLSFHEEGHFKQHILKHHKYEDVVSMALFREDFLMNKPELEKQCLNILLLSRRMGGGGQIATY